MCPEYAKVLDSRRRLRYVAFLAYIYLFVVFVYCIIRKRLGRGE